MYVCIYIHMCVHMYMYILLPYCYYSSNLMYLK